MPPDYCTNFAIVDSQYPESRIRNWNGYMLFYETMDKSKLPPSSTLPLQDPRGQIIGEAMRLEKQCCKHLF